MGNDVLLGAVPNETAALRELDRQVDGYIAYLNGVFALPDVRSLAGDPRRSESRIEAYLVPARAMASPGAGQFSLMGRGLPEDSAGD